MKCSVATSLSADNGFVSFWGLVVFSSNAVKISYCAGNGCFESKQEITLVGRIICKSAGEDKWRERENDNEECIESSKLILFCQWSDTTIRLPGKNTDYKMDFQIKNRFCYNCRFCMIYAYKSKKSLQIGLPIRYFKK